MSGKKNDLLHNRKIEDQLNPLRAVLLNHRIYREMDRLCEPGNAELCSSERNSLTTFRIALLPTSTANNRCVQLKPRPTIHLSDSLDSFGLSLLAKAKSNTCF